MKPLLFAIFCSFLVFSCKNKGTYQSFGEEITILKTENGPFMASHYKSMQVGDSMNTKIKAKVIDVCQAKGCWMTLNLEDGNEVMVKFKDYGFFVPKDIAGKEVIINGKAFVNEVSVEEQRHYAEDAGKTEAEIAAINIPKRTFSFEANGVLIQE
ncbi:DUF4920 domain-containing protein [Mariniflexile sp. AS56]|uniref:DUF4920 domain-containing protein n=1 Tax=Mariniflexile sp. AS56 TaxID=3063957 RepID=UPI0026E9E9EA|nr:DUF4920 domain-containing protein [Mariniflexile sp. AS56]MDO7171474.1 DUF4920 domain-containing protein [Mariniflexile sp. AS56]